MKTGNLVRLAATFTLSLSATFISADTFDRLDTVGSAGALHEAAGTFVPVFDGEGLRTDEIVFLLHGGYPPALDAAPAPDVWVFVNGYWQHITSDAPAMASHSLIEGADGRAWAVGAIGRDGWTGPMDRFVTFEVQRIDGRLDVIIENTSVPGPTPDACFGSAAVAANGGRSIFTIGGSCLGNPLAPDPGELWEYRIDDNRWTRRADVPEAISNHTAVIARDYLWVFGGSVPDGLTSEVYRYDLLSDTWGTVSVSGYRPAPRRDHRAVVAGTNMLIFGGVEESFAPNIATLNDVWQLDLDELVWTEKTAMETGLAGMITAVVPRRMTSSPQIEVLIYGGLVDVWAFPPELSDSTLVYTSDIRTFPVPIHRPHPFVEFMMAR
jgi:hypothetical protein